MKTKSKKKSFTQTSGLLSLIISAVSFAPGVVALAFQFEVARRDIQADSGANSFAFNMEWILPATASIFFGFIACVVFFLSIWGSGLRIKDSVNSYHFAYLVLLAPAAYYFFLITTSLVSSLTNL